MTEAFRRSGKSAEGLNTKQGLTFSTGVCFNVGGEFWELFGDYILLITIIHQA